MAAIAKKLMSCAFRFWIGFAFAFMVADLTANEPDPIEPYNVIWESPSVDQSGSMPIGNGEIAANVWVEKGGDFFLLLSKSDAWDDNGSLLKLGRVRLQLSPNPFLDDTHFEQTLDLREGKIAIRAGEGERAVSLNIWIDANRPVIRVEAESDSAFDIRVSLEMWRTSKRLIDGDIYALYGSPYEVYSYPDKVLDYGADRIVWYHRNEHSIWQENLRHQGLEGFMEQSEDPLLNRTFGAAILGTRLISENATTLKSATSSRKFVVSIHPLTALTDTVEDWVHRLDKRVQRNSPNSLDEDRRRHGEWWDAFWNRSWIYLSGTPNAHLLTQSYILQRWISACAGRGNFPIKFNGSLFTVGGKDYDPDKRLWGACYWWQNTRLAYWPMLANGDFDMMKPLFHMYQAMLPLEEYRTKIWHGHWGAFIAETAHFWGMYNGSNYGFERPAGLPLGETKNDYVKRYFTSSPELMAMMMDYYAYTGDGQFLRETLLPTCDSLLRFWANHYKVGKDGKIRIYPAQSLETYHDASNPTPTIAGLRWVLDRLLALPENAIGPDRSRSWEHLRSILPPIPTGPADSSFLATFPRRELFGGNITKQPPLPLAELVGKRRILPAGEIFGKPENFENPELYAIFPFRVYGMGKPDLDLARYTFNIRRVKGNSGWVQDDIQAAYLGLTATAMEYIVDRVSRKDTASRFPAFWGPNFDWVPDQDHGGVMMKALQSMLIQADNGKVLLFPAWPGQWDVQFRLHAPMNTTVTGRLSNGKILDLTVTPAERKLDVIIMPMVSANQ